MWDVDSDPDDPKAFDAAVAWFRNRVPLTSAELATLTRAARDRAFTVAGVAELDVVADVWQALDSAIGKGTTLEQFKTDIGEQLAAAWGEENPSRLETIFRTNVQQAYGAGRYQRGTDPDVKEDRPFWRFSAVLDSRTSKICGPLHGTTLPADHPFWRDHNPPLHFNCRSTVVTLSDEQANAMGVSEKAPNVEPLEGFGRFDAGDDYQPDLSGTPPPLLAQYRAKGR